MVTVLHQRRLLFEGVSFVVLKGLYAEALAVEALPSDEAAATASRLVDQARSDGTLKPFGSLVVAFSGCVKPGRSVVNELREACVYIASVDLHDSAVDNAMAFLADVEARIPEVLKIIGSGGPPRQNGPG